MTTSSPNHNLHNVVDLFTGQPYSPENTHRIIRIAPELDGLEMLYSNKSNNHKLYSIKILCWALREDGDVIGLVPWLEDISPCTEINDALSGHWEGYYDPRYDDIFFEAPIHKVLELETAAEYYDCNEGDLLPEEQNSVIQELPDTIGTHAVLSDDGFNSITLKEVVSWQLLASGKLQGMLINDDKVASTPVLPGDTCLYPAKEDPSFCYYFQHHIANKIKAKDPEALAAISALATTER